MKLEHLFRALAVGSVLVAGSCSVANDGNSISEDGARNHPIAVEPSYRDLKVQYAGGAEGMSRRRTPPSSTLSSPTIACMAMAAWASACPAAPAAAPPSAYFGERAAVERHQPRQDPGYHARSRQ